MISAKGKLFGIILLLAALVLTMTACDLNGIVDEVDEEISEITSVEEVPDINVVYGTDFEDIGLPEEVEVTLADNSTADLEVNWLEGDYDGDTAGTYTLVGDLVLPDNITNPDNLHPTVDVIVAEEFPAYSDDYLGLQEGLEMESEIESETVLYDEDDDVLGIFPEEFSLKSIVESKEYINDTARFIVKEMAEEETAGGSIFEREGEDHYLAGYISVVDGVEEKHFFDERKKILSGKIEQGDTITIPLDFQPYEENDDNEIIIEPITLEAVDFEKVEVPAGEFMAWKLEGEEEEWVVTDDAVVNIVEMKIWFVPYLGFVQHEIEIEINFLEPQNSIDRVEFDSKSELVDYSI